MGSSIKSLDVVKKFRCLAAECPDTCCQGWDMPADVKQRDFYTAYAPELLDAIAPDGAMCRVGESGPCAQLCDQVCSIHARYGETHLGDACYFYPRLMHRLSDRYLMAGAISCPEMLRLMVTQRAPFAWRAHEIGRLPQHRRDLMPAGMRADEVEQIVCDALMMAEDNARTPEQALEALLALALSVEAGEEVVLPPVEAKPSDAHAIYYALALTEAFGRPGISKGLAAVMEQIEQVLDCRFDRATRQLQLGENASRAYAGLRIRWQVDAARALAPTLRRWLAAQVAMTMFPFGGFAEATMKERASVLVQRFATVRLALMCHVSEASVPPDEATVIRVISAIARFQDHLADIDLTRMIHRDSGWESVGRLRGLVVG